MAISWTRQTVFDAGNSAVVNTVNIRNQIKANLIAHASGAWSEVETYTVGIYSHLVMKCAAAQSGLAADFYVVLSYTTTGTQINMMVGEGYNSSTHVLSKYAPGTNTNVLRTTLNADTTVSETFTLFAGISGQGATQPALASVNTAASVDLWMQMSERHFVFGFGSVASAQIYAGACVDTFLGADDPMPVGISAGEHSSASSVVFAMTRHPLLPTSGVPAGTFYTHGVGSIGYSQTSAPAPRWALPAWAHTLAWPNYDKYWTTGGALCEVLAPNNSHFQVGAAQGSVQGVLRGKRRGVRVSAQPSGGAYSDTVVAGGRTWFCVYVSAPYALWMDTGV